MCSSDDGANAHLICNRTLTPAASATTTTTNHDDVTITIESITLIGRDRIDSTSVGACVCECAWFNGYDIRFTSEVSYG